jgi:hypothetical protein
MGPRDRCQQVMQQMIAMPVFFMLIGLAWGGAYWQGICGFGGRSYGLRCGCRGDAGIQQV